MSRSRKRQSAYSHRNPRGNKQAKINDLRSVPPGMYDDVNYDRQCFNADRIIRKMYNSGMEIEEIERKIREDYRMPRWQWEEIIRYTFGPTTKVRFEKLVCLNDDNTQTISISCPNAIPYFLVSIRDIPIRDYLIIRENDLLRMQITENHGNYITEEKIYPFPNPKWTKILLHLRDHYLDTGMIYQYIVNKWQLGFDKCTISAHKDPLGLI